MVAVAVFVIRRVLYAGAKGLCVGIAGTARRGRVVWQRDLGADTSAAWIGKPLAVGDAALIAGSGLCGIALLLLLL